MTDLLVGLDAAIQAAEQATVNFVGTNDKDPKRLFDVGASAQKRVTVHAIRGLVAMPVATPSPPDGEVGEVVSWLNDQAAGCNHAAACSADEDDAEGTEIWDDAESMYRRAASILTTQAAENAALRERAERAEGSLAAATAPTHTDLMVPPESLDAYMAANPLPTHRHKKRGTLYVLLGIGKTQAESWRTEYQGGDHVDMCEVAIYRSVDDGSLWVRPREKWEDGRFEAIPAPPSSPKGAS